ncbi:MAG: ADOP family duplicated permease [Vicinamibacteria bacterium]|nr:ADOP family duplicated permease [Vicinamibacteria bacterium]
MTSPLNGLWWAVEGLGTDVRLSVRSLARTRGFTLVALLSLALGIGANAALFSVVHAAFLRPVPGVAEPDRVVELLVTSRGRTMSEWTYPDLEDVRTAGTPIQTVAGWKMRDGALVIGDASQRVRVLYASSGYFAVLGVRPAHGRPFRASEDVGPGQHPSAIVSHSLWRNALGGRTDILGAVITLDRTPYTVVGVAPETFRHHRIGETAADLWVPLMQYPALAGPENWAANRNAFWVEALGRLRPGATVGEASSALATVFERLAKEYPDTHRERAAVVAPFGPLPARDRAQSTVGLAALLASGALVLFIICTNLAGMMFARGASGQHDLAVRAALGASRGRLVRRVLVEAAILALGGGALGGLAAWWATRLAASSGLLGLPDVDLTPDARVFAFSCLLVLATALVIGLLPALRLTRVGAIGSLRDEIGGGARRAGRFHRVAVSAQVGVAVLFVAVSGVFFRSLSQLDRRDLGFDPQRLLVVSLDLSAQGYDDPARGLDFADRVRASVAALPGVRSVAIADGLPVDLVGNFTSATRADSRDTEADGVQTEFTRVGPGFFETVGTRLLRGRGIEAGDTTSSPPVVVITRRLAERLWPGADALGREVRLPISRDDASAPHTVVGVVPDVASSRPTEDWPQVFVALAQHYDRPRGLLLVRSQGDAASLTRLVQSAIRSVDPQFAIWSAVTSSELLARSLEAQRVSAATTGGLGLTGLLLSAFGVYGLVAFVVSQRTREFGVRMALGASRRLILGAVLGDGLRLAAPGLVAGLVAASGFTLAVRSMLLGVAPLNPAAFGLTVVAVLAVVLLACAVPAVRAAGVDPSEALRAE